MSEPESPAGPTVNTAALAALEIAPFALLVADTTGQALAVNKRWMDLSGMGRAASLGAGWLSVLDPEARTRIREDALRVVREGGVAIADYELGGPALGRWTRWWIGAHDMDGRHLLAIAVADVHDDHTRQANLYHLATHDPLTGLFNRSHFVEAADQALRRSERHSRHVGMVFVDLDDFKRVNDIGGHALGDRVLYAVGARLRHCVRSADLVARIGGDEFAVLCEDLVTVEQAQVVAERIAAALAESVELDGQRWTIAASVGAAVDEGIPDSAEELLDRADRAMYEVKSIRRTEPLAGFGSLEMPLSVSPPPAPRTSRVAAAVTPPDLVAAPREPEAEPEPEPPSAAAAEILVEPAPDPAGEARHHLLTDILALRDSLDAIRERLGRLATTDGSVIDIREGDRRGVSERE